MKYTKLIVSVVASLLAVAGESGGQSVYERAHLEAHRWEVVAAKESAAQAREFLDEAKKESEEYQPVVERARNDASLESFRRETVEKRFSMIEAQLIAAQAGLSVAEARIVTAEAVFAAVQTSSEEDFLVAVAAHESVQKAVALILEKRWAIREIWGGYSNMEFGRPPGYRLATAWASAALAAQAAERAEAIVDALVDALNDGGPLPPELLEPLPN